MRNIIILSVLFVFMEQSLQAGPVWADSTALVSVRQHYTSDKITYSAVRGFKNFLGVQQGVVLRDGLLRIHGGGVNENSFLLNGFNLTTVGSQPAIYLIPEALSSIDIHAGNFSVTQNALGTSLISSRLKSGGPGFQIKAGFQTDKFAGRGKTFLDTYSYREHNFVLQAGGSIMDRHRYYIALENQDVGDTRKVFNNGITMYNLKNVYDPDSEPFDLVYPAGFTPGNSSRRWAVNSFFNFDFKPFTLDITALYDWRNYSARSNPIQNIFNKRDFNYQANTLFMGLSLKYALNNKTKIRGRFGYYEKSRDKFDEYLGNNWKAWGDSAAVVSAGGTDIRFSDRWTLAYGPSFYRYGFMPNGAYEQYNKSNTGWLEGGLDFNTTLSDAHMLDMGVDWRDMTLRYFSVNPQIMRYTDNWFAPGEISVDDIPKAFFDAYAGKISGYDRSGHISDDGEFPAKRITHTAAYFNYRYSYDSFIAEAGIRYNFFNTRNTLDPINADYYFLEIPNSVINKKLSSWDPRVSLSYIADREMQLNIGAGIYTVSPFILWQKFGYDYYDYSFGNENSARFNQARQLQQFSYFNVVLKRKAGHVGELYGNFYWKKQFREWKDDKLAPKITNPLPIEIKGLDVAFRFFSSSSFSPKIQYSYYQARKSDIEFGPGAYPYTLKTAVLPLVHNQSLRANMEYRFTANSEKADQTRMNIIFRYENGHPFVKTYPYVSYSPFLNGTTTPWTGYVDVRMDKSWYVGNHVNLNIFIRVNNLFNVKNTINVFPETGTPTEDRKLEEIKKQGYPQEYVDFYRKVGVESGEAYRSVYGRELYSSPRQIFFGMEISY